MDIMVFALMKWSHFCNRGAKK